MTTDKLKTRAGKIRPRTKIQHAGGHYAVARASGQGSQSAPAAAVSPAKGGEASGGGKAASDSKAD